MHSETAGREFLCALREEFCCSRQVQRIFAIPQLQLFAASQLTSALKCNKGKCNQLLSTTTTKRKLSTLLKQKEKKEISIINLHKKPVKINKVLLQIVACFVNEYCVNIRVKTTPFRIYSSLVIIGSCRVLKVKVN